MEELVTFFSEKKVLVTGDTGFKGSWLSLWLSMLGAKVTGYALPPENDNDHFNILDLEKRIKHIDGDINNTNDVINLFKKEEPEIVFHLAAQPLVRLSYDKPVETFKTNVLGSVNILEAIRETKSVKSAVYVTSDKCYRNNEWAWGYRENDALGGHDPYSASKAAAEVVFSSYVDSFFSKNPDIGIATVRAGNVIGGGDWALDRIVPDCIRSLIAGDAIPVRNPVATRPWQHVLEPLSGYLTVAAKLLVEPKKYSGAWNFGPRADSVRRVQELVQALVKTWGIGEVKDAFDPDAVHEAGLLMLNCDKANTQLEWYPKWDFEETVDVTVKWYKKYAEGFYDSSVSENQIEKYMEEK